MTMQKRKTADGWRTELTKPERKRLSDALCVLSDLSDIEPGTEHARQLVESIVGCIDEDGVYSEAVPEVADAK
jgi:hypothetical protein